MSDQPRATLSLRPAEAITEREVELDVVDARLPCRKFHITYKVAEVGRISLTAEFLLRLVRVCDGLPEAEAADFFGFSMVEAAYVVGGLEEHGYLDRSNGKLWLSDAGRSLFVPGSDEPEIYKVEQRTERHDFDLISLAPGRFDPLSRYESALPELGVGSSEKAATASKQVFDAFRRHFDAVVRRKGQLAPRQSLYSVDDVSAGDRFSTLVPIAVQARSTLIGSPEPDLSELWSGYDLDDRSEVMGAAAALIKDVRVSQSFAGPDALRRLAMVGKGVLDEFVTAGVVRRDAFYREAVKRAGEFRIDRQTVPIVGSLFTNGNRDRLRRALQYARTMSREVPDLLLWQTPSLQLWGATRRLPQTLDMIRQLIGEGGVDARAVATTVGKPSWRLLQGFDAVLESRADDLGLASLEVLLVPRHLTAVIVHTAMGPGASYPVPLGILSFDPEVVERARLLIGDTLQMPPAVHGERAPPNIAEQVSVLLEGRDARF